MTDTYTTAEAIEDFLTTVVQGITYWAAIREMTDESVIFTDIEEGDGVLRVVDAAALAAWAASPRPVALAAKMADDYQAAAIVGLVGLFTGNPAVDWRDVDYDADTADVIVQDIVFGELVYG